ncbi:MAG: hypothetical protein ACLFMX_07385 [Halobacteriales archaeon]
MLDEIAEVVVDLVFHRWGPGGERSPGSRVLLLALFVVLVGAIFVYFEYLA